MGNIVTNTEVFDFMGTPIDVRTQQGDAITSLITKLQDDLEREFGRKITANTITDLLLQDGLNCEIFDDSLYLKSEFRDMYEISEIIETGTTLTASTGYSDGGDYYLDIRKGVIIKIDDNWSLEALAIKLTGKYGLLNKSDNSVLEGVKTILIQSVAAKSGLWKNAVQTEDGAIETIRTKIPTDVADMKKKYINKDL